MEPQTLRGTFRGGGSFPAAAAVLEVRIVVQRQTAVPRIAALILLSVVRRRRRAAGPGSRDVPRCPPAGIDPAVLVKTAGSKRSTLVESVKCRHFPPVGLDNGKRLSVDVPPKQR